jgi:crossover junction endodeoxyribonuclease RuvC
MIFLGIDPGIATTGYGIIEETRGDLTCISFGCIKTPAKLEQSERLRQIRSEITKLIKNFEPSAAGVEQLFFAKNVKTALSVAHARGVVLETLATFGVVIHEYTPLQVKQATTSYGQADKGQIQNMVRVLLKMTVTPKPDDAADALAIAICCANSSKNLYL